MMRAAPRSGGPERAAEEAGERLFAFWREHRLAVVMPLARAAGTPHAGFARRFVEQLGHPHAGPRGFVQGLAARRGLRPACRSPHTEGTSSRILGPMDWSDLKFVLALSRTGSLVAAARVLGVEHTTVSRRIAAVERDLGVRLFTKTPEGHRPTPAGERAIAAAETIERTVLDLEAAVAGGDERPVGIVRVTTTEGFFPIVVPQLPRLYAQYPGIRVELLTGNRVVDLSRGEADVAVRFVPTTQPELVVRRVTDIGWALFASPEYLGRHGPVGAPADLAGHRVIGFEEPITQAPGALWLASHCAAAEVVLRGNSIPSVAAAVATGIGLSCLPCLTGDRDPRVQRASGVVVSGGLWLVSHPDRHRSARVRAVWDFLLEVIARESDLIAGRAVRESAPNSPG